MSKFTNSLNNIKIASPCSADWDAMVGNERQRFCGECKLNVYNLSGMSQREAENLLINAEGRLCVRFYRRADGTVITKDRPVGWKAIKQRLSKTATAFASLLFALISGIGLANYLKSPENPTMGQIAITDENFTTGAVATENTNSNVAVPEKFIATMGNMSVKEIQTVGRLEYSEIERAPWKKRRR